jgi:hypothetical protein
MVRTGEINYDKKNINCKDFNLPEKEPPVHIGKEAGWVPEPVRTL